MCHKNNIHSEDLEAVCPILESIAKSYGEGTPEYQAIETAAHALFFRFLCKTQADFEEFGKTRPGFSDNYEKMMEEIREENEIPDRKTVHHQIGILFEAIEAKSSTLEEIVKSYAEGTPECEAIKTAAFALAFASKNKNQEAFLKFMYKMEEDKEER